ncbi:MAG: hypothetical protein ABIH67_01065 [Candidatus Uhrbacteria bacterium]
MNVIKQTKNELLSRVQFFHNEFTHQLTKSRFLAAARNETLISILIHGHEMKIEIDMVILWRGAPHGYLFSGSVVSVENESVGHHPPIAGHIVFKPKKGWSDLEIIPAQLTSVF